jgi:hypothetical protein
MKTYKFHWLDGKVETFKGNNPVDALNKAGYGAGAIPALDWFEEITTKTFLCDRCNGSFDTMEDLQNHGCLI